MRTKLMLLLASLFLLAASPAQALKNGQKFDAWTVKCVSNGTSADACHIFQKLVIEGAGKQQKDIRMSVGFAPGDSNPITVIRLPLGLWLLNGISLTVDGGQSQEFPIQVCAPAGCQTTLKLQPDTIDALEAGSQLSITTYNVNQEPVQIPIDLHGFAAGMDALRTLQKE